MKREPITCVVDALKECDAREPGRASIGREPRRTHCGISGET